MIAQLRGRICSKTPHVLIIEVGGVGFRVFIPLSTFYDLPEPEEVVLLFTRTYIREEGISLYGFLTQEERALFDREAWRRAEEELEDDLVDKLSEKIASGVFERVLRFVR